MSKVTLAFDTAKIVGFKVISVAPRKCPEKDMITVTNPSRGAARWISFTAFLHLVDSLACNGSSDNQREPRIAYHQKLRFDDRSHFCLISTRYTRSLL